MVTMFLLWLNHIEIFLLRLHTCGTIHINGGSRMGHLGQMPPPPPPPSPFGGIILLIKILNFMSGLDQLTHENDMQILVAFINSPEIKAKQIKVKLTVKFPPALSCVLSASKNNYHVAVV